MYVQDGTEFDRFMNPNPEVRMGLNQMACTVAILKADSIIQDRVFLDLGMGLKPVLDLITARSAENRRGPIQMEVTGRNMRLLQDLLDSLPSALFAPGRTDDNSGGGFFTDRINYAASNRVERRILAKRNNRPCRCQHSIHVQKDDLSRYGVSHRSKALAHMF